MIKHFSYGQLLKKIPQIEKHFIVNFLSVKDRNFKLVKFSLNTLVKAPLLVIMAGCHGEEPASPLALFKYYKEIAHLAKKFRINLVIYPLVNPWGFDRNYRFNKDKISCNSYWEHSKGKKMAEEAKTIYKDLKKLKPVVFANLHEDDDIEKEFYIFSFCNKKFAECLVQIGKKYFPILQKGKYGRVKVKNGVVHNHHDGTAEDFMSHRGCKFSCCTETPSKQPLKKRIKCYSKIIYELIKLANSYAI
jgi:predicted deacylase